MDKLSSTEKNQYGNENQQPNHENHAMRINLDLGPPSCFSTLYYEPEYLCKLIKDEKDYCSTSSTNTNYPDSSDDEQPIIPLNTITNTTANTTHITMDNGDQNNNNNNVINNDDDGEYIPPNYVPFNDSLFIGDCKNILNVNQIPNTLLNDDDDDHEHTAHVTTMIIRQYAAYEHMAILGLKDIIKIPMERLDTLAANIGFNICNNNNNGFNDDFDAFEFEFFYYLFSNVYSQSQFRKICNMIGFDEFLFPAFLDDFYLEIEANKIPFSMHTTTQSSIIIKSQMTQPLAFCNTNSTVTIDTTTTATDDDNSNDNNNNNNESELAFFVSFMCLWWDKSHKKHNERINQPRRFKFVIESLLKCFTFIQDLQIGDKCEYFDINDDTWKYANIEGANPKYLTIVFQTGIKKNAMAIKTIHRFSSLLAPLNFAYKYHPIYMRNSHNSGGEFEHSNVPSICAHIDVTLDAFADKHLQNRIIHSKYVSMRTNRNNHFRNSNMHSQRSSNSNMNNRSCSLLSNIPIAGWSYYQRRKKCFSAEMDIKMVFEAAVKGDIGLDTPLKHDEFGQTNLRNLPQVLHAWRIHIERCVDGLNGVNGGSVHVDGGGSGGSNDQSLSPFICTESDTSTFTTTSHMLNDVHSYASQSLSGKDSYLCD